MHRELICHLDVVMGIGVKLVNFMTKFFLWDGKGVVRRAILYADMSCPQTDSSALDKKG